jgi:hypothetical protein
LVKALRQRERVGYRQLLLHSVQIWADKVAKLPIVPIFSSRTGKDDSSTLYAWTEATDAYDPDFLGYMAGVIPLLEGLLAGCFLG